MLKLIRDEKNFRSFWLGQVVSQVGDRIHSLALLWIVYKWTGSGLAVGGVLIAATLPGVLIGPVAGSCADRWNRRQVMIWSDVVRAVIGGWLAWRAWAGVLTLPELLIATAFMSIASAFFNPAAMAILPNIVSPELLTNANALSQLSASASGVLGPIVGSALIAVIGVPLAFLANSVSFLFSAACEYRITLTAAAGGACRGMLQDIQEGWKAMIAEPLIARTIVTILVVNFFFSAIPVMVPVLAEGIFKTGAAGLGVLMSSFALGMLLGAAGLSAMHAALRRGVLIIGGLAALGMAFLFMSMILSMPVTIMGLVMAGLALSAVNITLISLYQEILPDRVRGRVFGFLTAISLSTQPIAYGVMGALVDILTPRVVFLFSGIIIVICSLNLIRCRELRSL